MKKANQEIRDHMISNHVSQRDLAARMGMAASTLNKMLATELPKDDKSGLLTVIDSIAAERSAKKNDAPSVGGVQTADNVCEIEQKPTYKFQIGDRVKIPAKSLSVGVVVDIWCSILKENAMYAVDMENGTRGLYVEDQLEPAPIPIEYDFGAHIDGNVAVVTMNATQGDNSWVVARGHAHIIHDGAVGMAQAVSYAARRMFEALDKQQDKKIYFKDGGNVNG